MRKSYTKKKYYPVTSGHRRSPVHVFIVIYLAAIGLLPAASQAAPALLELSPANSVEPLRRDYGYMLVSLEVGGSAPSMEISRERSGTRTLQIPLKDKENGFYLAPLKKGKYDITRVNAPYFDLPFHVDTTDNRSWEFNIEAGKINYIGRLHIDKERGARWVEVRLLNRLAAELDDIRAVLGQHETVYPLVSGSSVRDDFLETLEPARGEQP